MTPPDMQRQHGDKRRGVWPRELAALALAGTAAAATPLWAGAWALCSPSRGSDVIATGGSSAGDGGNGYFHGSLIDVDIAIYAPINIAIASYNSTADAGGSTSRPQRPTLR